LACAKKADDDLQTIEEAIKRLKEREKGKAKAAERAKRVCMCLSWTAHLLI
jgi:hypothetical protein